MTNIESQNGAMHSAFPVETTAKPRDPDVAVAQLRCGRQLVRTRRSGFVG